MPQNNDQIAQFFDEIGDMLEILGENVFRVRAYRRGAEAVRNVTSDIAELPDEEIEHLSGIGKDLHLKIREILETGGCEMHTRLLNKLGTGILDMLRIRGVGPKKVKLFYDQLEIQNLDQLRAAAESGALATLPGMGEKSEAAILEALNMASYSKERIPYEQALEVAEAYIAYMKENGAVEQIDYAGSLRRKKTTIGDVDLLVCGSDPAGMSQHFVDFPGVRKVLGNGETKSSVLLDGNVQVDLRVVPAESYGAALLYFTGSKHFNIRMRTHALQQGLKINEYGVFRGEEKLAGETEGGMFEAVGMDFVEPEGRED